MTRATSGIARPILKWAGGKTQLLPQIRRFYPPTFEGYLEPFVGSAAVFVDLYNRGQLAGRRVRLTDGNRDLIGCYQAVRDSVDDVIEHLAALAEGHRRFGSAHFYDIRDQQFNPMRARLFQKSSPARGSAGYSAQLAAMLIYLNKTGYNGLFRLNSGGGFNVPVGRYRRLNICDADNLRHVSAAFKMPRLTIAWRAFTHVRRAARADDFIYFDPPYAPLSRTARFTSYTASGFSLADHMQLRETIVGLAAKGCWVLLSNSTASEITALYAASGARAAGLASHRVLARRAINSRSAGRQAVEEYLITNLDAQPAAPNANQLI